MNWKVPEFLCDRFCSLTKTDISAELSRYREFSFEDVKLLISTIHTTLEFESGLNRRFTSMSSQAQNGFVLSSAFNGKISAALEPYLKYYLESEEKVLSGMADKARVNSKITDEEFQTGVFTSSTELFIYYRKTFPNFAKLTSGKMFVDLSKLFGKFLGIYCDVIKNKLIENPKGISTSDEIKTACIVLNTADYCHITTSQVFFALIY